MVWLDFDNTAPWLDRRKIRARNFYRGFSSDRNGVRVALDTLYRFGHRRIVFPRTRVYENQDWQRRRIEYALEEAREHYPDLAIRVLEQKEDFWIDTISVPRCDMLEHIDILRRDLASEYPSASESRALFLLRERLSNSLPSLAAMVEARDATAILAPNQRLAIDYYYWFRFSGIEVPGEMSIVGFDNFLTYEPHPVSSVDFRLQYLGYAGAHILVGDVPVNADRWGNIPSEPQLVDRGSLGTPTNRQGPA